MAGDRPGDRESRPNAFSAVDLSVACFPEIVEVAVAGQPFEAVVDELAAGLVVTAPVCKLGLQEGPLG